MTPNGNSANSEQGLVCEEFMPTDHPNGPGHYCELPAVTERDGKPVCEAHRDDDRYFGAWRYWLFGIIPLKGSKFVPSQPKGPHIWRFLGVWRKA